MIGLRVEKIDISPKSKEIPKEMPMDGKPIIKVERIAPETKTTPTRRFVQKEPEGSTAMGNAMLDKFPWTADSIAAEFDMPVASFRAWKQKAEKEEKIKKPKIGSLFCIKDPENALRFRYSDAYVDKLKALRGGVRKREDKTQSAVQHAKLRLSVPVFDDIVAKFLIKKFGDNTGVEKYLRDHLIEIAKPAMAKIEELRRKYEEEMAAVLGRDA